jgi:hypothetical protein
MPIKVKFNEAAARKYLEEAGKDAVLNILEALDMACKQAMTFAKNVDTYKDQTGNLRSSIGYVLYQDGKEVKRNFYGTGQGSSEGGRIGENKAKAHSQNKAIVGVLVAGMKYAAYVEAMGYDVITGASFTLIPEFKKYVALVGEAYGLKFKFS